MGHVTVNRGTETDILFRLKDKENGSLVDDADWVDGSTAAEWPVVVVKDLNGADVTSSFVKNITSDTVSSPKQKHPDGTTGIIRDGEIGKYRLRVKPLNALTANPTKYRMYVTFDIGGAPKEEMHEIVLQVAGDVEFGSEYSYAAEADVTELFELYDVVSTTEVQQALGDAEDCVNALLEKQGIVAPYGGDVGSRALKRATVAFARAELRRYKAGVIGPGLGVRSIQEGDTKYEFVGADKLYAALYGEGVQWTETAIDAILGGAVYVHRGKVNVRDQ